MAEGNGILYNNWLHIIMEGTVDVLNDTLKLAILDNHTPNDENTVWGNVESDQCTDVSGYTAGGKQLTTPLCTVEQGDNLGKFDADDVEWTGLELNETPSHVVLYSVTATNALIAIWECTTVTNGGDYTIQWNSDGILTIAA